MPKIVYVVVVSFRRSNIVCSKIKTDSSKIEFLCSIYQNPVSSFFFNI